MKPRLPHWGCGYDAATTLANAAGSGREAVRRQVKETGSTWSLCHRTQEISGATNTRQVEDPVHIEPSRHGNWTYQLLLHNAVSAKCLKTIMRGMEESRTGCTTLPPKDDTLSNGVFSSTVQDP